MPLLAPGGAAEHGSDRAFVERFDPVERLYFEELPLEVRREQR